MCGIAGYFQLQNRSEPKTELIKRMLAIMHHRGPDEKGLVADQKCGLGHTRLSIIDLTSGSQPIANEDNTVWVTFNGEIFNYQELRSQLKKIGHTFKTESDTEVIVHAYEQWGKQCMDHFNGQFAFAIYDQKKQSLLITRDRLGICPLFYTIHNGCLYLASEIKALFCHPDIKREIDIKGVDEIFTWWTTAAPRTAFKNIYELEAGHYLAIKKGHISTHRYWDMVFPEAFDKTRSVDSWAEELHDLLLDSVRLRLRADVPVGAYLSGGLDSSGVTALIKNFTSTPIESFSIQFEDEAFDESSYQDQMSQFLNTQHHQLKCSYNDIAENFMKVIWHTERPIVRTAPTPLYLLSNLVRQNNFKVVLTGEGADEIFIGYDLFKETMIRNFWAREPNSSRRVSLFQRLYPTLPVSPTRAKYYLESFYREGLLETDKYYYSHIPRINTTSKIKAFFSDEVRNKLNGHDALAGFGCNLPDRFSQWHYLAKAQYLEARSLLSCYLLSSQGDRMSTAHSVEVRPPFLDHRLVEFAAKIPPSLKLSGLNEKFILKRELKKPVLFKYSSESNSPTYPGASFCTKLFESGAK